MDLPNIEIVVQWKATCDMCTLWQRFGRVARGVGRSGTAILLVERKDTEDERRSKFEKSAAKQRAKEGSGTKRKAQDQLHRGDQAAKRPVLGDCDLIRSLPNSEIAIVPAPPVVEKSAGELTKEMERTKKRKTRSIRRTCCGRSWMWEETKGKGRRARTRSCDGRFYKCATHLSLPVCGSHPLFSNDKTRKFYSQDVIR